MQYYDMDYIVNIDDKHYLSDEDKIVDVYIKRVDHYCERTNSYWDSKQDEAVYLKLNTKDGVDKIVCLAKNIVSESEIDFDTPMEKEDFFQYKHDKEFYNQVFVYATLSDEQAITFLSIMNDNMDNYDYNFQYCNQNKIIKNIVKPNLDSKKVEKSYSDYLEKSYKQKSLEQMVNSSEKNDKVINFSPKK